ncbi:hypothetical protein BLA60_36445 [Actinophytocola xinjiangensis]|uniref:ABC3 transporter permease C-terminal domain-containing protein n=1 Tax=Actinophytocola xinjiangensis TaxID=485602 RepID=A0A7Z0WH95_9PSEU|nr:FtsX-like permease family protein [Actinophytocola xinjiangensis]OLF05323.1 hypothetical protein BLA60_36445 [Actinophytocola xinjiangensis]
MLRFVLAQTRGRPRRTLALLAGVLVATTGFTVLSAGAAVQRLRVEGTVAAHARTAYDILVRPAGSRTDLERDRGLIAPNQLSALHDGITPAQLDRIRQIGNVEVAAPVAMLGHVKVGLRQTFDLTDQVDPDAERQLFRLTPTIVADRGLTVLDDAPHYVYLSRHRLVSEVNGLGQWRDRTQWIGSLAGCVTVKEIVSAQNLRQVCVDPDPDFTADDGTTARERTTISTHWIDADGRYVTNTAGPDQAPTDRFTVTVGWDVLVLAAAIDPDAEAALVGLDDAVVTGRYLTAADRPALTADTSGLDPSRPDVTGIPVITANATYLDQRVRMSVERLDDRRADSVVDRRWNDWVAELADAPGTPVGTPVRAGGTPWLDGDVRYAKATPLFRVAPLTYRVGADGTLHPRVVEPNTALWGYRDVTTWYDRPPRTAMEPGFRPMTRLGGGVLRWPAQWSPVGAFDPGRLADHSRLTQVPLETYQAPQVTGADDRSRRLLGGQPLRPNGNPADYLATPPLVLTNLASLSGVSVLEGVDDPISAVRVRVAGVTGVDDRSQELLRTTAERIATATGLDVDVTIGSSPSPQTVALPAGPGGRPALTVTEHWSRKGAAVEIVQAADRKSVALFGLILVVCTLFLGNAVAAAVRERRRELALLSHLGWPASRIASVVFAEVLGVGLVAGILAGALALGLAEGAGAPITVGHALLALPVALGVTALAAAAPAILAARSRPPAAPRSPARARRRTTVLGVALANLWRSRARTALGVTALAVGVGALTVLLVLELAFRDDVVGSLLGDAVALRVRTVDVVAAGTTVCLGVLMVADVLHLNVRERAAELAVLVATGWSDRALLRLVGYEGLAIGVLGAGLGCGLGLLGVGVFTGELRAGMVALTAAVAAAAVAVAGLAAVVAALVPRRLPLSTVLAEE